MTHAEFCTLAAKWLTRRPRNCRVAVAEPPIMMHELPDALGWNTWGCTMLIEVKTSRSDFLSDAKKPHRSGKVSPMGDRRWYLAPAGILRADEMPEGWGLLEVHGKGQVREPRMAEVQTRDVEGLYFDMRAATVVLARFARGESPDPKTLRLPSVRKMLEEREARAQQAAAAAAEVVEPGI